MNNVNTISLPVPTMETIISRTLSTIGIIVYGLLLLSCILYLLWWVIIELRDHIRTKRINKYLYDDRPIEYILDYPGYAIEEYCTDNKHNND